MDKNTFTGLFLIMVIMGASIFFMRPSETELKKERLKAHADSIQRGQIPQKGITPAKVADTAKTPQAAANNPVDSASLKGPFGASIVGTEKLITLENKDIRVQLTTVGGKVASVELKNFKTYNKKPLILFQGDHNHFGLNFTAGNNSINTDKLYFTPVGSGLNVAEKDSGSFTMRLSYSPTQYIDYIYTLKGTGYKLGLTIKPTGLDQVIANSNVITIDWSASMRKQEKDLEQERRYSAIYYNTTENDVSYFGDNKDDQKQINDKKLLWVSFEAHFFSAVLLTEKGFSHSSLATSTDVTDTTHDKQMQATLTLDKNSAGVYPLSFYYSPVKFGTLKAQGYNLERQVYMGWGPLAIINRIAVLPVFTFLVKFTTNYGIIILVLTILLKLALSPLTYKSYLSMAKMRVLKPEMDEIKAKVGDDNPTLLQQEYLKLYKKAGVNPLGGCLPLLIQMPIVIAFFRFFPSLFELRGQSFLWMHDLSTYDSIMTLPNIPFVGNHLSLMCLLMTLSTLVMTYFNNQVSGATGQMKYIGYITPVIFLGALNSYPSGLNYYYFLANLFTFAQQYLIRYMVDDKKIHAQIQENKKKPEAKKKTSGFQARMEEMMRQKQQLPPARAKKK
jgi:YidC/Oxa1 family membrane protein insertase